jgi:endonuclease YncB( thermonuclease family)
MFFSRGRLRSAFCLFLLAAAGAARGEETACPRDIVGSGTVKAVIDGRSLALEDGREVRLAGIEVPLPPQGADPPTAAAVAAVALASRRALGELVANAEIVLRRLGEPHDRYGRIEAHVFITRNGSEISLQRAMLGAGHARVAARLPDRACAADFLARERTARAARLGLWAQSYYDVRRADAPAELLSRRGQFALVEGKVVSVRESGGTIYVNFGRRWSEDFTVTILKRNERTFVEFGLEPKKLQGQRVLVRGWIEQRGGPWIEATRPEQIEIADRR